MTVLYILTSLRFGGTERLVTDLLLHLRREGAEVALLLLDGTRTDLYEEVEASGIPVRSLSKGWKAMRNPLLLFRMVRFLRKNPFDVVHTHNTASQLLGAAASLFLPLNLVTTEHSTSNRRRSKVWLRPLDQWLYSRYRKIACVSEDTENALLAWLPGLAPKTVVIPNGIRPERFRNSPPDPALSGTPGYKVLMVAAFRDPKDQATLIRAFRHLPDRYRLYLAGGAETPEEQRRMQKCRDLVHMLGLDGQVLFLGVRKDVPALIAACDVSVLSTHYEGFGLSALEAMASGKPVIASHVKSLDTIVGGAGLLFPPGDATALSTLIREVCEDPEKAADLAEKGRQRAKLYDIAETARRYRILYENLIVER